MWSMSISTIQTPQRFSHSRNLYSTAANPNFKQANLYRSTAKAKFGVTAKFGGGRRRRRAEDDYRDFSLSSSDDEEEEDMKRLRQMAARESASSSNPTVQIKRQTVSWDEAAGGGKKLSGSDILLALQKASANKHPKLAKSGTIAASTRIKEKGGIEDYSNVKPLCINKDWDTRLDELDNRLRSLFASLSL